MTRGVTVILYERNQSCFTFLDFNVFTVGSTHQVHPAASTPCWTSIAAVGESIIGIVPLERVAGGRGAVV